MNYENSYISRYFQTFRITFTNCIHIEVLIILKHSENILKDYLQARVSTLNIYLQISKCISFRPTVV